MKPRLSCLLPALLFVCALLVLGCGDDSTKPKVEEPTGYPAATTIDLLVENFKSAYEKMDYDEFAKLLHPEFSFVFDPADVGPDTWPEATWGIGPELDATRKMFSGEANRDGLIVESIRLDWTSEPPEVSPDNSGWMRVVLSPVDLELSTVSARNGDQVFLITPPGYQGDFHVVQSGEIDEATEEPIWKIILWVDRPPSKKEPRGPGTQEATWGQIMAGYR